MEYFFKAVYKCILKPALAIEVDEDNLLRVHEYRPRIQVSCKGIPFVGLIHSGSKLTMMRVKTFERLGRPLEKQEIIEFFNIDGVFRRSWRTCRIPLKIGKTKVAQVFTIVDDNILSEQCLLGADFLAHFQSYGFICNESKIFAACLASQGFLYVPSKTPTPQQGSQKSFFVCCKDCSNSNYSSQTQTPSEIQDPMNESSFVLPTEDELKMFDQLNWSKDFELVENMASTFGERTVINSTLNKVDFNFFFQPQIPLQEHINVEATDNESLAEIMAYEEAYIQHAQRRFELLDYASIDDEELDYFKWNAHVLALEKLFKPNGDPKSIQSFEKFLVQILLRSLFVLANPETLERIIELNSVKEDVWLTYLIKTGVPSLNRWREDTDAFADQFDDQILEKIKGIAKTVLGILEKDF